MRATIRSGLSNLRIVIANGTGRLALLLANHLHDRGHVVSTLSRFPKPRRWEAIHWDGQSIDEWASSLELADAVINLSEQHTDLLGKAIALSAKPPRVWLNAQPALSHATRTIELRVLPVMNPAFGAFPLLLRLVRSGFGGSLGDGTHSVNWVHDSDFASAVEFLIDSANLTGPIEVASPSTISSYEFMKELRDTWSTINFGVPTPEWLIQALQPKLLSRSAPIQERVLLTHGFAFQFPDWRAAADNLLHRWHAR